MSDLISRDALYQALHEAGGCDAEKGSYADGWDSAITEAIKLLDQQPAVDSEKHGYWIWKRRHRGNIRKVMTTDSGAYGKHMVEIDERYVIREPYCSECGALGADSFLNYCPKCGAKMDGERK